MNTYKNIISNTYEFIETGYKNAPKMNKEQLIQRLQKLKEDCAEEIDEFIEALNNDDYNGQLDACCDLLTFATNMPIHAQIPLEELEKYGELVHTSNMTKYCKTYQDAVDTQKAYSNGIHPNKFGEMIEVEIKETGNPNWAYMVTMPNGGKIMKSIYFVDTIDVK